MKISHTVRNVHKLFYKNEKTDSFKKIHSQSFFPNTSTPFSMYQFNLQHASTVFTCNQGET